MPAMDHREIDVDGHLIHVVEAGAGRADVPSMLFLHGWPESWAAFEDVMRRASDAAHVLAIDLPGVGGSPTPLPSNDKRSLAAFVHRAIEVLQLRDVTLVGHDVGGQIVYAFLRAYPDTLDHAVIMNVAIPGIDPWAEVVRNRHIWHFGFHAIPELPERLVTGHEAEYFDFFFNAIAASPDAVPASARATYVAAYQRPDALRTGFAWYRAFPQDERDNAETKGQTIDTPVLYLRGEREPGDLDTYVEGLRAAGIRNVHGCLIPGSGHFSPDERPAEVVALLQEFLESHGAYETVGKD
jgi:pimeloyl-ACP methyl ester carboxylesterase